MEREIEIIETSWEWEVSAPDEVECNEMGVDEGVDMLGANIAGIAVLLAAFGLLLGVFMRVFVE